jgi:hypothetical protein
MLSFRCEICRTHDINDATLTANIPQSVLSCVSVSREITFHAPSEIQRLRLEQQILLHGKTIEEHAFDFGYVIASSTNTWEQIIIPDQGSMLNAVNLSGNLIIVNHFYDADVLIAQCDVKIFYI